MFQWFEQYGKHFALNFGQALQGIRYFYSHPDLDRVAPRASVRHVTHSVILRASRVANDLFFALIPPDWHHSAEELAAMRKISFLRWFQYGYCAWRFTETGEVKNDLSNIDKRWDPRCRAAT